MKLRTTLLLTATSLAPAVSMAEWSGNVGYVSDYIFRGIFQEDSSASAGLDYEADNGLYIGTWAADVGDGLETDLYFGYSGSAGDFGYSVGFTGYYYTDDWDDTYEEINLGISYGGFSLDFASGEWDGFGTPSDYTFTSIGYAFENGLYLSAGSFGDQADGDYYEIGYGFSWQEIDFSVAVISSNDLALTDPNDTDGPADYALVFGITKGISFGD